MTNHGMYDAATLKSYEFTKAWFSKARWPDKGRPYGKWAKVMRNQSNQCYEVHVYDKLVCSITPANTLRMEIDGSSGRIISNTLSQSIYRLVPITWTRVGMGRYRILSTKLLKKTDSWWIKSKESPELFKGLEFDLATGNPLNARPDMVKRVDTDVRREWLRALRRFKQGIRLRAKMGVFDGIEKEVVKPYGAERGRVFPDWGNSKWLDLLYASIRDDQYPKELLMGFILTEPSVLWNKRKGTKAERMTNVAAYIINSHSVELRTRFGVFADEVTDNGKAE